MRLHGSIRVTEKQAAPNTNEDPAESLQHSLALKVLLNLLDRVKTLAVTLHSQPVLSTLDDKVDSICASAPLRPHSVSGVQNLETPGDLTLFRVCWFAKEDVGLLARRWRQVPSSVDDGRIRT